MAEPYIDINGFDLSDVPDLPSIPEATFLQMSLAEQLSLLPLEEREAALVEVDPESLLYDWNFWGRPEQIAPETAWHLWVAMSGRGWGKTRCIAEWVRRKARENPGCRITLVARTAADCRDVIVNGDSGVLAVCPPSERPEYFPSRRSLEFPNGSVATHYTAAEPDTLRGPQAHFAVCDELAAWNHVPGMDGLTAWDQVQVSTRLGENPQIMVATTPKRVPAMRALLDRVDEPGVIIVRGSTMRNRGNLSKQYLELMASLYGSTRIGKQELEGILLDDIEGALWTQELIDLYRSPTLAEIGSLPFRVLAVDPSVAENPRDECGLVVVGATATRHLHKREAYVLEDATIHGSPGLWARTAVETAKKWKVAGIVAEGNQGAELVRMAIQAVDPTMRVFMVHARQNKALRAEPVVAAYEKGRVHHVGYHPLLEAQMTSWEPGVSKKSPDRCVARGTEVTMGDGSQQPIENVLRGQYVMTRVGPRRVLAAGRTAKSAAVLNVQLGDGRCLRATANHPVWADSAFHQVDTLHYGMMATCLKKPTNQLKSPIEARSINEAQLPRNALIASTTFAHAARKKTRYTARSTSARSGRFLRAITFTISMVIHSTMTIATWKLLLRKSTRRDTQLNFTMNALSGCLRRYTQLPLLGMDRQKAASFTDGSVICHGKAESTLTSHASTVENQLQHVTVSASSTRSATAHAGRGGVNESIVLPSSAKTAVMTSTSGSTAPKLPARDVALGSSADKVPIRNAVCIGMSATAAGARTTLRSRATAFQERAPRVEEVSIESVLPAGHAETWNLTIESDNEYFANGVLVHNCDALVYAVSSAIINPPKGLFSLGSIRAKSYAQRHMQGVKKPEYSGHRAGRHAA